MIFIINLSFLLFSSVVAWNITNKTEKQRSWVQFVFIEIQILKQGNFLPYLYSSSVSIYFFRNKTFQYMIHIHKEIWKV
jgi:hypothetical protein